MTAPTTPSLERQPADAGGGLLPCPWCGGEGWLNDYEARWGDMPPKSRCPQCRSCGANLGYRPTPAKAIAAWNRRSPAPQAQPDARAVEALKAANEALALVTAFESDARYIMGNTNFTILQQRREQVKKALQALSAPAADDGWRPSREDVARTIRDRAQIGGTDWQRNAGGADINADDLADAILALRRPAAPEEIKAAYQRGWNDRESDIIERAERIAPQSDALAVLDRLLAYSGARGTYDAMRHGDAVKEAEALLASSADVPEGMMTLADELTEKADELDAMEARGEAWGIGDVVYVLRRAAIAFRRPAAPTDAEERS